MKCCPLQQLPHDDDVAVVVVFELVEEGVAVVVVQRLQVCESAPCCLNQSSEIQHLSNVGRRTVVPPPAGQVET